MAVMKDVAKLAGVSITTVSFVLNGSAKEHKVADKTVRKVWKAATQLGYKINSPDIGNFIRETHATIAFFTPMDSTRMDMNVVYASISRHIEQTKSDYSILMCPYKKGLLLDKIEEVDMSAYNAAVIGVDSNADAENLEKLETYMPFVLHNASSKRFSSVSSQVGEVISRVVKMVAAKGYQRVVILAGSDTRESGNEYLDLFIRTCADSGIQIPEHSFITTDNTTIGGAIAARRILGMHEKPEIIICMNSSLAYGAIPLLARNEFLVPKNAELICFGSSGDADLAMNYIPSLSMITIPDDEITMRAFDIALHLAYDRDAKPFHLICPCNLLINHSFAI